ncbi:MAG: tRNA pseudouridine(38-40) synthase TruA [Gemmatimonadota bacterium]|nr:tRNA pseudouridine(38-40) synthase TruA [Gemmatimonadota bacterium]
MDRNFLLQLEFDGGQFAGWQRQAAGRTVQGELERVLSRLADRQVVAHGAGRTDAGVHAEGLGVTCLLPARWDAPSLLRAVNALLPEDCRVVQAQEVSPNLHARRSASARTYRYELGTDPESHSPFRRRWEWALARSVDLTTMAETAARLVGEHDFHRLSVRNSPRPHYRCVVRAATWEVRADGTGAHFHITADRFLHHMVRMLVGTMVDIGLGRRPGADLGRLLQHDPSVRTSPPAPAEGLYFVVADYPSELLAVPSQVMS